MEKQYDVVIVGAGLSGLSVAHFLGKIRPDLNLLILEKNSRAGGAIHTLKENGFLAEWGPHGFLDNVPESRELLTDIGLDQEAQKAPLADFVRYVCSNARLVPLPQRPQDVITSPLLTMTGKLRLLAELWKKPIYNEQTVGQWASHRFGKGILPLVDAAVTGTFAGDMNRLSMDAVMPGIRDLELKAGSVFKGMIKKKKKSDASKTTLPAMTSFPEGMERLIEVLARNKPIRFNTPVDEIRRHGESWQARAGDDIFQAAKIILALPVNRSLTLAGRFSAPPIAGLAEARIVNVVLGFRDNAKIPFGFGYLAPEKEKRFTMGAMFSTHMFPGRAPRGSVLLEALVGGRRHPERLDMEDEELVERVLADLGRLLELPDPPRYVKVLRTRHGIPQLETGCLALEEWRKKMEKNQPGLLICGFGWGGIGMNEMIKAAKAVARAAIAGKAADAEDAAVKPVYF